MWSPRKLTVGAMSAMLTVAAGVVVVVAANPAQAAVQKTVYVSPSGNDANPGTSADGPVKTLQRARDLVRGMNKAMTGDIVVSLAGGTYQLSQPLTLDATDSGTDGHRVIWSAAPDAHPVISGGIPVTGWKKGTGNVWSAPAPAALRTRQLYVNGVRATRASGPLPTKITATTAKGYTTGDATMDNWHNPKDIEFIYRDGLGGWTEPRCPVAAISPTAITMAEPCWTNTNGRLARTSSQAWNLVGRPKLHNLPTLVENAYELLDSPGEWYLDRSAGTVYYIPRSGENPATANVVAPVLETLVIGAGTASAPIHDITFSGLQFSYATWLRPATPEGLSEVQATISLTGTGAGNKQGLCGNVPGGTCPYGNWTPTPGSVSFRYAQGVQFLGDGFTHLGAAGLTLGDGTQNTAVNGSVFTDISGSGLQLGGLDLPQAVGADRTSRNTIADNHFTNLPIEFHGGVAVNVGYAERTSITHNQIDAIAYTGISIGWGGWMDKIQKPAQANYSNRNSITDNLIFDHMLVLNDGGGVYVNGIQGDSLTTGLTISGNVIHDENGQANSKGIYTDNGATYVTITGNGLYHNPIDWTRRHNDYRPNATTQYDPYLINGNYWMKVPPETTGGGVTITNNHAITAPSQIPTSITGNAGLEAAFTSILNWKPAG
jgi:Right handed beta helix region